MVSELLHSRLLYQNNIASRFTSQSVCTLITKADEADVANVVCKFQAFNRQVSRGACICIEGDKYQGEEHTSLGDSSAVWCSLLFCTFSSRLLRLVVSMHLGIRGFSG